MLGVLEGFFIVWAIIAVGWFVGRRGVLGPGAQQTLSRLAFFVGSPALLFGTLSKAKLDEVLGPQLAIAGLSAAAIMVLYVCFSRFGLKRKTPESVIGGMSASMANSANLGLPIAAYVLGDASLVAPLLIFQLAIMNPINLMMLDATTSTRTARQNPVVKFLGIVVRNPTILASGLALIMSALHLKLPDLLMQPINLIGGLAIPAMLMAFGMSLSASRPFSKADGRRIDISAAVFAKLILHPTVAFLIAHFVFGLDGHALFAATVAATLPTAQNVFVAASRYQQGVVVAKDTVLITTVAAIPAMILVALFVH